ncbi:MAG: hypothetical protein IT373_21875 [Polyangiaceae bacterium]|nr:hypothetical protein [Polyangiaceae bacterium]
MGGRFAPAAGLLLALLSTGSGAAAEDAAAPSTDPAAPAATSPAADDEAPTAEPDTAGPSRDASTATAPGDDAVAGDVEPAGPEEPELELDDDEQLFGIGPRAGISFNGDQWLVGTYGRFDGFCVGGCTRDLALTLQLYTGFGGNHVTLRASLRFEYTLWFLAEDFGLYPIVGGSFQGFVPVGAFGEFCRRVHLGGCGGWEAGLEAGAGLRVWRFSFEGVGGIGGIPVLTVTGGFHFPLWSSAT